MTEAPTTRMVHVQPEHDAGIATIIRNALKEFGADKPGTVYYDETTDHLSQVFAEPRSSYFILYENNRIAGGAGIFPTNGLPADTAELVKMYLAPEYRKKGYAAMLMKACFTRARELGYNRLYIETMPELKDAIAFYEKYGFRFLSGPLGNSGHTGCDLWMIKEL